MKRTQLQQIRDFLTFIPSRYLELAHVIGVDPSMKNTAICDATTREIVSGPGVVILGGARPFECECVIAFVEKSRFSGGRFKVTRTAANETKKAIRRWWPRHNHIVEVDPNTWHMAQIGFRHAREALKKASITIARELGYDIAENHDDEADAANIAEFGLVEVKRAAILRGIERS